MRERAAGFFFCFWLQQLQELLQVTMEINSESNQSEASAEPSRDTCLLLATPRSFLVPIKAKWLHSQQQPSPWDCFTIPKLQLPATAPYTGLASLSRVCMAAARTI